MPVIRRWRADDGAALVELILPIQREEFGLAITAEDQPDLADVRGFYGGGCGGFWVADAAGRIVGSIGLKDLGGGLGAIRKMFVAAGWRGREKGVGQRLLDGVLAQARAGGLAALYLGTAEALVAAHRFYEKNGFRRIEAQALPAAYPRMAVDTRFYARALG